MPKPRVLVIGPVSPHVTAHIELIQKCASQIHLLTTRPTDSIDGVSVNVLDFSIRNPFNWWLTVRKIKTEILQFKPDVIHVHQANACAWYATAANRELKLPLILSVWGSDILLTPQRNLIFKYLIRKSLKRVTLITAGSKHLGAQTAKLVEPHPLEVHICSFGVAPYPIDANKENIIYSNRNHEPLYRIDQVIRMFQRFSESPQGKGWRLVIAGKGTQTKALRDLAQKQGLNDSIDFVGFVSREENHTFCAKARLFVSIPESDSAAISLLEAMYHKCLPVISNLPATNEWVSHGVNGFVVNDLNTDFFSAALNVESDEIGVKNRAKIEAEALSEHASRRFCNALDRAIEKHKSH